MPFADMAAELNHSSISVVLRAAIGARPPFTTIYVWCSRRSCRWHSGVNKMMSSAPLDLNQQFEQGCLIGQQALLAERAGNLLVAPTLRHQAQAADDPNRAGARLRQHDT